MCYCPDGGTSVSPKDVMLFAGGVDVGTRVRCPVDIVDDASLSVIDCSTQQYRNRCLRADRVL